MSCPQVLVPLLACLAVAAHGEWPGESSAPPTITVYTQFDKTPSGLSVREMKTELDAIMAASGVAFTWRSVGDVSGNEIIAELVVVHFRGVCEPQEFSPMPSQSGPLGWTHTSDGQVLPFSDVDCDRIRSLIYPALIAAPQHERSRLMGRAMGRVLAHELYHIFTNSTHHGGGLAKPVYTGAELVSNNFRFENRETNSLRNGRLKGLLSFRAR